MFIVNLYPVSKGGGLQNAFSFINELSVSAVKKKCICFVRKESEISIYCKEKGVNFVEYPSGLLARVFYEFVFFRYLVKKYRCNLVFTLFGNPPVNSGNIYKISGFARSNIIEKNVDFWAFLSPLSKIKALFIDKLLRLLMLRCNVVILETDRLKNIALKNNTFGRVKLEVVKMSPSSSIYDELKTFKPLMIKHTVKILYLSGAHPNKNIHLLSKLFESLNSQSTLKFVLVTTLDEDSSYYNLVFEHFSATGVSQYLNNVGTIIPSDIPLLIKDVHALINVSTLESFSNNWVEAWASNRLLICKDSGYARDSCAEGALYIDLKNTFESAKEIINTLLDEQKYKHFCTNGNVILDSLPSPHEKFNHYLDIINKYEKVL